MRVLVTGGAGYVGSHAAKLLAESGHEVWIVDNLAEGPPSRGRQAAARGGRPAGSRAARHRTARRAPHRGGDALRRLRLRRRVGHASRPSTTTTTSSARSRLLDAMRAAGVQRIVFSSTCATYGMPDRVPITEDHPQRPINPYGYTKLVIEHALADYAARLRPRLRRAALLQRLRRGGRRHDRRRPRSRNAPHPARPASRPRPARRRRQSSAPTTPRPTAPASATTSTSTTWPPPTSPRSRSSSRRHGARSSTSAPAAARACRK